MINEASSLARTRIVVFWIGILGTFLIMGALVELMRSYTRPAPVNAARAEERRKALEDVNRQARDQLENYGWIDASKGIVRLPIAQAMELTIHNWKNPSAARSNLIARVPIPPPPPPKQPEKPSEYE